jgi:signal transduction histidine kinase
MAEHPPSDEWVEAANCLATVAHTLSSAVHEANNMLQVITGSAEMIQMQAGLPPAVVKRTEMIAEQAQRVSTLIGSLRDLSKVDPRRAGEATNLVTVITSALDLRRHALNRGQIAVSVDAGDPPPMARAGWRPLMQIVLNLLLNAEQAVQGRAGAAIAVRAVQDGDAVTLSIADNGAGLPEQLPLPWTLQERPDASPLLGLGLVAVRRLAEREGGSFELRPGADGTTAVVRLKVA